MTKVLHRANGPLTPSRLILEGVNVNNENRWLIVGLGNPGTRYAQTFHNVGFMAIEYLAQKWSVRMDRQKERAEYGQAQRHDAQVYLIRPQTFMNLSGEAVQAFARYMKVPAERILVIYDDIDLPMGQLRIRAKGSAGTHNGMRNIVKMLGTTEFPRIRIGIGPKPDGWDIVDYVLAAVPKEHQDKIFDALVGTAGAIDDILTHDLEYAMNKVHRAERKRMKDDASVLDHPPLENGDKNPHA